MTISDAYRLELSNLHASERHWGTSSYNHIERVANLVIKYQYESMLDVGCGKGVLIEGMKANCPELKVQGYDPAVPKFNTLPEGRFDLVTCTDVLEHIEPEHLDAFLDLLVAKTKFQAYLVISLVPAKQLLSDGRNAHLIVQPAEWWLKKLVEKYGFVQTSEMTPRELIVICNGRLENV